MTDQYLRLAERPALRHPGYPTCDACDIDSFYVQGDWEAAGYDVQQSMLKASRDALDAALAILNPTAPHLEDQ